MDVGSPAHNETSPAAAVEGERVTAVPLLASCEDPGVQNEARGTTLMTKSAAKLVWMRLASSVVNTTHDGLTAYLGIAHVMTMDFKRSRKREQQRSG
eukprot:jgi/Chlat1/18/ChrspC227975S00902